MYIKTEVYRDGGTRHFKSNTFSIFQDNRIFSKTQGEWFDDYPDKGNILTQEQKEEYIPHVIDSLRKEYEYAKYLYEDVLKRNAEFASLSEFNTVFSLKSSECSPSQGYTKEIYNSKDNYVIMVVNDTSKIYHINIPSNILFKGKTKQDCYKYYLSNIKK